MDLKSENSYRLVKEGDNDPVQRNWARGRGNWMVLSQTEASSKKGRVMSLGGGISPLPKRGEGGHSNRSIPRTKGRVDTALAGEQGCGREQGGEGEGWRR